MAQSFTARYSYGRCAICDAALEEGQELVYVEDQLSHADCAEDEGEEFNRGG